MQTCQEVHRLRAYIMCLICALHDPPIGPVRAAPPPRLSDESTEEYRSAGVEFLRRFPTIDIHSHPGRFFMEGAPETPFTRSFAPPFTGAVLNDIQQGGVGAVVFAAVSDHVLLDLASDGIRSQREFAPGEAYRDYLRQMKILKRIGDDARLTKVANGEGVLRAHRAGRPACLFSVEGADFVEDRLERLEEAQLKGVCSITIIHYHVNQIGDTQTESPRHGGLTDLGRELINEMNCLGLLIDLSHASPETCRQAVDASSQPMLFSHSNLAKNPAAHPRMISQEHAQWVTQAGGLVGATAAGFEQSSFREYIGTVLRMIDILGVDHVAIGTDMDFTYQPVFTRYQDWSLIPGALLAHGMHELEVAKILGGNFLRVLDVVRGNGRSRTN